MASKKLEEKKKKQREAKSKESVLRKRTKIREQSKKDREIAKAERNTRQRIPPFVRTEKQIEFDQHKEESALEQLENNLKILEALEEEYLKEQAAREQTNAELEADGHMTLKEKMDALEIKTKKWVEKHPEIRQPGTEPEEGEVEEAHDNPL